MSIIQVNVFECKNSLVILPIHQGVVFGVCGNSTVYCHMHIQVPQGLIARAHFQRLSYWCDTSTWETVIKDLYTVTCGEHSSQERFIDSSTNHLFISHYNFPPVKIMIEAAIDHNLVVVHQSIQYGYVILQVLPIKSIQLWAELETCLTCVIMVSFQYINNICTDVELVYKQQNTSKETVLRLCVQFETQAHVFFAPYLKLRIPRLLSFIKTFKMCYSFHSTFNQPQMLHNGLFNCSVQQWQSFQHHLDCNLKTECDEGQDETEHCPFSSPECQGLVASRNKCFKHIKLTANLSRKQTEHLCLKMGGTLASVKTRREHNDFVQMFKHFEFFIVWIGFISGWNSVPFMYSKFRKWSDYTLIYNIDHLKLFEMYTVSKSLLSGRIFAMVLDITTQTDKSLIMKQIVCETKPRPGHIVLVRTVDFQDIVPFLLMPSQTQQSCFYCTDGYTIHTFLSCDPRSCSRQISSSRMCLVFDTMVKNNTPPNLHVRKGNVHVMYMFKCDDDKTAVPYTLICNFIEDCPDSSDETFCIRPSCTDFLCSSGQCVGYNQICNGHSDCLDDSDEISCNEDYYNHIEADRNRQLIINLDGTGYFTQRATKDDESCPDTHYHCITDLMYCLPVYTRCNGFSDCTHGEDEQHCDVITCPAFYRCLTSKICVHGDHLCDGWGQCPLRDDEWLCDMTCPKGCLCQGHSFLCSTSFSANYFPHLRFLDVRGSGIVMMDLNTNVYLIYLSLSSCSLYNVPYMKLFNLQLIDLSNNFLQTINISACLDLPNLRILILSNNPMMFLTSKLFRVHYTLRKLDLSRTRPEMFNNEMLMYLPNLQVLNLSLTAIAAFRFGVFRNTPRLIELDIRWNPFTYVHSNIFLNLNYLKYILSSNFRFCCKILFPKNSVINCLAPHAMFSSCTQMLSTDLYRFFFWLVSVLIILGNGVWFVASFFVKGTSMDKLVNVVIHYQLSNICMGISISTVTIGNEMFHGNYHYFEQVWVSSVICKMVAFLTLLSTELSVLIVWFMALNHVTEFHFPLVRLRKPSVTAACMILWVVGIVLSSIVMFSELPHWGLHDHSALCHIALFDCFNCDNRQFRGSLVIVVYNSVLCLLLVAGQIVIFRQTPKYTIASDTTKISLYFLLHLFKKISIVCVGCWFSFAVFKVMVSHGVVPTDVYVAMVVFMLPLNSTLSPLFFLSMVRTQQQKKEQEEKIMHMLKLRHQLSVKT